MVDERITQYIATTRKNGYQDAAIITRLKESGFSEQAIQEAFASVDTTESTTPEPQPITPEQTPPTTPQPHEAQPVAPGQTPPAQPEVTQTPVARGIPEPTPPKEKRYAGFWMRAGAEVIDSIIFGTLFMTIMFIAIALSTPTALDPTIPLGAIIAYFVLALVFIVYEVVLTAGAWQGTIGKHVLGLKVEDENGQPLSIGKSTIRYFAKYVFPVLWIVVAFTAKKQGLHDLLLNTYVVRK